MLVAGAGVVTTAVLGAGVTTAAAAGVGWTVVSCLYSHAVSAQAMAIKDRYLTGILLVLLRSGNGSASGPVARERPQAHECHRPMWQARNTGT